MNNSDIIENFKNDTSMLISMLSNAITSTDVHKESIKEEVFECIKLFQNMYSDIDKHE